MIKAAHKKVQRESFVRYVPEVIDTPQEEIEAEAYARQMRPDCLSSEQDSHQWQNALMQSIVFGD